MRLRHRLLIAGLVVVALVLAGLGVCFDAAASVRTALGRAALRPDTLT
jgi:hypothetical protein